MTIPVNKYTIPEIWYKSKRAIRTFVQGLVVLVPLVNVAAAIVLDTLKDQADIVIPGWVFLVLNGIVVVTALLMALVARLMANAGLNAVLTKFGLGSVPAQDVESGKLALSATS